MTRSQALAYPLVIHVFYGSDFDPSIEPVAFTVASEKALSAFVQGGNEADGWMGATFLEHANFKVDGQDQVIEGKLPPQASTPNERFVLWGDKPDKGAKPQRYVFDDEASAQAFEEAVNARVGWTAQQFVPGQDFRAYRDLDHALEEVDEATAQSLNAVIEADEDYLGTSEPLFLNDRAEYVQESWSPGEDVSNVSPPKAIPRSPRR
jgi:hypothetical protein